VIAGFLDATRTVDGAVLLPPVSVRSIEVQA